MPELQPSAIPSANPFRTWLANNRKIVILLAFFILLLIIVGVRFWPRGSSSTNTNTTNQTTNTSAVTNSSTSGREFERFQAALNTNAPIVNTKRPTAEETAQAIKQLESSTNTNTP